MPIDGARIERDNPQTAAMNGNPSFRIIVTSIKNHSRYAYKYNFKAFFYLDPPLFNNI